MIRAGTNRKVFRLLLLLAGCLIISLPAQANELVTASLQPFVYPVMGPRLSSRYGKRFHPVLKFSRKHSGVDLAAPLGSPIRAVSGGLVVFADPYKGYGNLVVIQHKGGLTTHYGHCETLKVDPGQRIRPGDIIATVGNTGHSTGPHLHFEIRLEGNPQNPQLFFPDLAAAGQG